MMLTILIYKFGRVVQLTRLSGAASLRRLVDR